MDYISEADKIKNQVIDSIARVVAIKSVKEDPAENAPFGEGPAAALNEFLKIGGEMGYKTVNLDNYAGYIEMGEGEQLMGIIGHADIVPEGIGWDTDPYALTVKDGMIYGRGVTDDKGPVIMALYAMKLVEKSGVPINKRIRLVIGANEETGMECVKHYAKVIDEQFDCGFTPDAEFPLIFGEKGSYHALFSAKIKGTDNSISLKSISGGDAVNVVCNKCMASFTGDAEALKALAEAFGEYYDNNNLNGCTVFEDGELSLVLDGVGAHASTPELGKNAISHMARFLSGKIDEPFINAYNKLIGLDYNGRLCGAYLSDEYGELTFNVGMISTENDTITATIDIRYPITLDFTDTAAKMKENFASVGLSLTNDKIGPSLYIDPKTEQIKALYGAYVKVTGDETNKPFTIGGGTYAKAFKNIVAFGPEYLGGNYNIHMANECYSIKEIVKSVAIFAEAIENLLAL